MAGYGDDSGLTAWLASYGLTLPVGAPASAVLRQRGSAYVDSVYGPRLECSKPTGGVAQERAWPRTGHIYPLPIAADAIPLNWVNASYRAAYLEAVTTGGLAATLNPNARVQKQKVDVIERTFFDNGATKPGAGGIATIDAEIDGMLAPFLCPGPDVIGLGIWAIGSC